MPKFVPKRFEQIFAQMLARVVARTNLSDVSDTAVVKHVLAGAARSDDEQYYQMILLLALFSIDTATGDDLDERAKDIQPGLLIRIAANKATGSVVFSRAGTTGTSTVAIGTKVKTPEGLVYTTTTTGTITAASPEQISGHGVGRDSNLISVIADEPGAAGNVAANTISKFETKPAGVDEVTNPSTLANGSDKETDDSFRQRIKDYVANLARCTVDGLRSNTLGQQDPTTSATALFIKVWEDPVARGNVIIYVDDGTGAAEATDSPDVSIAADLTWNGTTTVTTADTSEAVVDDWIRLDSDGQWFQITTVTPSTSFTILNPGTDTIPTGGGAAASSKSADIITAGLDVGDVAVGGEITLWTDNKPIKSTVSKILASSVRGNLIESTDWIINPATGQLDFTPALVAGEQIVAGYTYFTGLIAFIQKIIDGDSTDRVNFPGLRAAGVLIRVLTPSVLLQNIAAIVTVKEGFDQTVVKTAVRQAIKDYINTLSISDDVLRNEIIAAIMAVPGVKDVILSTPVANTIMLDDQLARTQDPNITIT